MDNKNLYQQRVKRMEDAQRGKVPDRVPVFGNVQDWAYYYAGFTINDINEDIQKSYIAFRKVAEDFYWDALYRSSSNRLAKYFDIMGGGLYSDATGTLQIDTTKIVCMSADEYPLLIKDFYGFIRDVIAPRIYSLMAQPYSEEKYQTFVKAYTETLKLSELSKKSEKLFREELGMFINRSAAIFHPLDLIMDYLRNFQGVMIDIKRQPDMVINACEAMEPLLIRRLENAYPSHIEGKAISWPMHMPPFLKPKDFEKIYWPTYKKMIGHLASKGYVVMCYFERKYEHLYDYLQELPKGMLAGLFEDDDLRTVKKKLGSTMSIAGGMELYTLKHGTKQQCLDMAKGLIDDLAPGGGYIFNENRILTAKDEVNPDNLKAVNEFVKEYGVYK